MNGKQAWVSSDLLLEPRGSLVNGIDLTCYLMCLSLEFFFCIVQIVS